MTTITASLVTCAGFICVGGGTPAHFMDRAAAVVAETKLKGIQMTNETTALELPEPAFRLIWCYGAYYVSEPDIGDTDCYTADQLHACAEMVRAPLVEENARLKARLRSVCQTLVEAVGADGPCDAEDAAARAVARVAELEAERDSDRRREYPYSQETVNAISGERDRLRAEVEAKAGEIHSLRDCLAECLDDLSSEINARALGELPRRIERDLAPVRRAAALLAQPSTPWVNPLAAEVEALTAANAALRADAERWRAVRTAGGTLTLRLHNTQSGLREAVIDAAIAARNGPNNKEPTSE